MVFPLIPVLGAVALGGTTFGLGTWLGTKSATPTIVAEQGSTVYSGNPNPNNNLFGFDPQDIGMMALVAFAIYAISKK